MKHSAIRGAYNNYASKNRTKIGSYNTKNGPALATMHITVPKSRKQQREGSGSGVLREL